MLRARVVQHRNWLLGQGTLFEDGSVKSRRPGAWNLYQAGLSLSVNGLPRPHPPAKLHDCECMQSEHGSGEIRIHTREGSVTFAPTPL